MGTQPEQNIYDSTIYQWEVTDPVQGGLGGVANTPLLSLADRTNWLKHQVDALVAAIALLAPINSPNFTGSARAPNVADGDDSTLIANTHFIQRRDHGYVGVTTTGGTTVLAQSIYGVGLILVSGALTSNATIVFPAITGKWMVFNGTTGAFRVNLQCVGQATPVRPVQGFGTLIWSDSATVRLQDPQLTGTGEVTSADLAGTGVGAGAYNKANFSVGVDGRITSASNGVVTFADVVNGLGFTPVQQGGGASQLNNKIFMGWDSVHLRAQVDNVDMGRLAMIRDFGLTYSSTNQFRIDLPTKDTGSGNMFIQMFGGGANHSGSGQPETTLINLPSAYPSAFMGAVGCYLGNTPPANLPIAVQPWNNSQVGITVTSSSPVSGLGVAVLAFGF